MRRHNQETFRSTLVLAILCLQLYAQTFGRVPFTYSFADALLQETSCLKRRCSSILPTKCSYGVAKKSKCQWCPWPQSLTSLHPSRTSLSASANSNIADGKRDSDDDSEGEWICGNVYKDLDRLEQGINFANAEQNLKRIERMEMLRHFAKARRPLFPDIRKFLIFPLLSALLVRLVLHNGNKIRVLTSFWRIVLKLMDYQFWTMTIASPIILLAAKRLAMRPPEPMPKELIDFPPEYLQYITTDWVPPEKS